MQYITEFSLWLKPYVSQISMAFVATLLVIYGNDINRWVKRQVRGAHFIFRTLVFVVLCGFGYGLLTTVFAPLMADLLLNLGVTYLGPVVVLAFVGVGLLAEHRS